jgi:tetratricopeptide (TPR) repeat protein
VSILHLGLRRVVVLLALLALPSTGCKHTQVPGSATNVPMGTWSQWQTLQPLVDVAHGQVDKPAVAAMREASELLAKGRALSADRALAKISDGAARHWITVARADLAAIHFTRCIRGVAWRIEDRDPEQPMQRGIDFDPQARIEAGDVSVEAMLTNLDAALGVDNPALQVQARIARARVTAFVSNCAPNDEVAQRASDFMRSDLATLAAEGHLPPDLAYVWGGIQMNEYSGAAARPFLLQAREGGYLDPSVGYLLAVIALEQQDFDKADALALEAAETYAEIGDAMQEAQCWFIRGEVERERGEPKTARAHYEHAIELMPAHVAAMVGIAGLEQEKGGVDAAVEYLHSQLPKLVLEGELDEERARTADANVQALVILTNEDLELAQISRDALLLDIDAEPDAFRRGLRYYYAATLDVRLGDYTRARGHGAFARDELAESSLGALVDVERFMEHLDAAQ